MTVQQGNPHSVNLQPKDLLVTVDGNAAPILSLKREDLPQRIVLLVDVSASMTHYVFLADETSAPSRPAWFTGTVAAMFALKSMPEQSRIALVTFSEQVHASQFQSKAEVQQQLFAMRDLKGKGHTALYDALEQSLAILQPPKFGDLVVLVSDGGDNQSKVKQKTVAEDFLRRGVRLYPVLVETSASRKELLFGNDVRNARAVSDEERGLLEVPNLAKLTGGSSVKLSADPKWLTSKDADEIKTSLSEQFESVYRLDLQLGAALRKPAKLRISSSIHGLELNHPLRIEPCAITSAAAKP